MRNLASEIIMKVFAISNYGVDEEKPIMNFHSHNTMEFSYVLSGDLIFYLQREDGSQQSFTVSPHQLLIIFPGVRHKTSIPQNLESVTLELASPLEHTFLDYLKTSPYVNSFQQAHNLLQSEEGVVLINDTNSIQSKILSLKRYAHNQQEFTSIEAARFELEIKSLFLEILTCEMVSLENKRNNIYLKRALSNLEQGFFQDISFPNFARDLGISPSYLRFLFAKDLKTTFKKKQNEIRIKKSCHFLEDSHLNVEQIARSVGYKSVQVFEQNFQKVMGVSPSSYRKKIAKPRSAVFTWRGGPKRDELIYYKGEILIPDEQ